MPRHLKTFKFINYKVLFLQFNRLATTFNYEVSDLIYESHPYLSRRVVSGWFLVETLLSGYMSGSGPTALARHGIIATHRCRCLTRKHHDARGRHHGCMDITIYYFSCFFNVMGIYLSNILVLLAIFFTKQIKLLSPFQIIRRSNNLGELKFFMFNQIYIIE